MRTHPIAFIAALGAALVLLTAAPGRAQALATPFVGSTFSGDSDAGATTFGLSLASGGVVGLELDLGTTRNPFDDGGVGDSAVSTVMGNLVVAVPVALFRPYVVGGLGLVRTSVDDLGGDSLVTTNDLGMGFGFGAHLFVGQHIGVRGDVRYFRASGDDPLPELSLDLDTVDFWRGTGGITFRW